ncbi:hypothetical protein BGW42_000504 [Actinomortierella wolfii]|nr:hypothetical protein BGW42_000504 [Actinomortierella wolfii]
MASSGAFHANHPHHSINNNNNNNNNNSSYHARYAEAFTTPNCNNNGNASNNNSRIRSLTSSAQTSSPITTATTSTATTPTPTPTTTPIGGISMMRGRSQGSPLPPRNSSKSISAPIPFIGQESSAAMFGAKNFSSAAQHTDPSPTSPSVTTAPAASRALSSSTSTIANNNSNGNINTTQATSSTSPSSSSMSNTTLSAAAAQSNGLSSSAASSVDLVGKRLREEQLQSKIKAAREFIESTLGITLPHADLHESLKDGVILCKLANRLRPGTVEQISLKNLPFVKMENISNFLNAAKKLGVQSSDLFQTVDLYEGKDMVQVVSTILTLARVVGSIGKPLQASKATNSSAASKRPGPTPLVFPDLEHGLEKPKSRKADPLLASEQPLTRVRSKTAHTPSIASLTPVIRPSNSSYYAAQIRKLEEDSIRYSTGIEQLQKIGLPVIPSMIPPPSSPTTASFSSSAMTTTSTTTTTTKERHLSAPVPPKGQLREKASRRPSLDDIVAGVETPRSTLDTATHSTNSHSSGTRGMTSDQYLDSASRTATILEDDEGEADLPSMNRPQSQPHHYQQKARLPRSTSGSALVPQESSASSFSHGFSLAPSSLESGGGLGARRKKKSISLDPQAANAIMQGKRSVYRDGLASPISPGLTSSASYNGFNSSGMGQESGMAFKQHSRFVSEKVDLTSIVGSPSNSRSTTPVQGLRKSTNSTEPLREKLDLVENGRVTATFQLGNCIGRGQFGAVYKALNLGTGQMVAVKRIKIDGLKDSEMDILMQEVELLKTLSHPSIVKYEGFIRTYGHLNIILEFVENGSLFTTLKAFGTFPEKLVVAYVVKILEGLVYLHGKEVVHCDLKAANILTTKNGNVKLSDFGVSLNMKVKESDFGAVAGTPNWMAPEVIELKGASPASDIWSLGCTIIEMLTGRPPYADLLAMTTLFRIVEDDRPPLPNNISADLLDFLCQCFQKDPALRPTASMLSHHRWILRNFNGRDLKPMDSLPYIKRKSLEPKEAQGAIAAAKLEREEKLQTKRALTPAGLSSGVPSMAGSTVVTPNGLVRTRSRRGSVDSISGNGNGSGSGSGSGPAPYSSATAPAITAAVAAGHPSDKYSALVYDQPTRRMHQFVKSSFAKPVECRFCHESVKSRAVICQDCNLVFHKKCQPFVGDTCFPNVFPFFPQAPSPAHSAPNLKMMANGIQANDGSRPSSRTSMNARERARSVTPSKKHREHGEDYYSAEHQQQHVLQAGAAAAAITALGVARPSSRQSNQPSNSGSPTSPTLAGLKNFIAGPRRFSFGVKKHNAMTTSSSATESSSTTATTTTKATEDQGSLPTPPTSISSTTSFVSTQEKQQKRHSRPASQAAVPITRGSGGRRHREYLIGLMGHDEEDDELAAAAASSSLYQNHNARPSAISLFSTSAPSSHTSYGDRSSPFRDPPRRHIKHSASSSTLKGISDEDEEDDDDIGNHDDDDDDEEDEDDTTMTTGRFHAARRVKNKHRPRSDDFEKENLDTLIVPSSSAAMTTSTNTASPRATSSSSSRSNTPLGHSFPNLPSQMAGNRLNVSLQGRSMAAGNANTTATTARQNGYQSSESSTAALTSSYSSVSNGSSPASSLGSVAALLEEEDRALMMSMMMREPSPSVPNGYNVLKGSSAAGYTQGSSSNHVGIRTMMNRFNHHGSSSSAGNISNDGLIYKTSRPIHSLQTLHDIDDDDGNDDGNDDVDSHYFASRSTNHGHDYRYEQELDVNNGSSSASDMPSLPEVHVLTPGGRRQSASGLSGFSKQAARTMANVKIAPELALGAPPTTAPTTVMTATNATSTPSGVRRQSRSSRQELGH